MMLIKNGQVVTKDAVTKADLLIEDGVIQKIGSGFDVPSACEVIDADGCYVMPGIVDLNVRIENDSFNLPNLDALCSATYRGGVTGFVLSPRFAPLIENETLMQLLSGAVRVEHPTLTFAMKALRDASLTELNNIAELNRYNVHVVQENSSINSNLIRRIMQYALMKDMHFFTFCENQDLNDGGVMHEGDVSFKLGMPGISKIGEISEVAKMVQMSMYYRVKTHFQALSTVEAVTLAYDAKAKNPNITNEVSIHHLILDDSACDEFNTYAKLNPPLRCKNGKAALIQALQEGKIDMLTALHSPKSVLYKDVAFEEAKFGIDAIERYLSLCYTYLVKGGIISLERLTELISTNPAKIAGLHDSGEIKEGWAANVVLFDPDCVTNIGDTHTPYQGEKVEGCIRHTIYKGNVLV